MAGFYPDVPAPRIAYDRDGTIMVSMSGSFNDPVIRSQSDKQNLNDYSSSQVTGLSAIGFIFPEIRSISGWYFAANTVTSSPTIYTSTDTTNGEDGNWTSQGSYSRDVPAIKQNMRQNIHAVNWAGIKGIRWSFTTGHPNTVHIYGATDSYAGADTLRIWHPTLDDPLDDDTSADGAWLDWGDVVQGTTADKTFRIKNNSATLTANSINISTEVFTNTTPTLESQVTYSNGGAFTSSLNIGNLAPGALSPVITARKATDITGTIGIWDWRTNAEATSWS